MDKLVKEIQQVFESGRDYQIRITDVLNESIDLHMHDLIDIRIIHNPDSLFLKFNDGVFYLLPYQNIVAISFFVQGKKQGGIE